MIGWEEAKKSNTTFWKLSVRTAQAVIEKATFLGANFNYPGDTEELSMTVLIYNNMYSNVPSSLDHLPEETNNDLVLDENNHSLSEVADEWLNQLGVYENRSEIHADLVEKLQRAANSDHNAMIRSLSSFLIGAKLVPNIKLAKEMAISIIKG